MKQMNKENLIESYEIESKEFQVNVKIYKDKPINYYHTSLLDVSEAAWLIIRKIREEIVNEISLDLLKFKKEGEGKSVESQFKSKVDESLKLCFGELDKESLKHLTSYISLTSLGLGEIEYLLDDPFLEEIVINGSKKPAYIYHKKYGWLKTNVIFEEENQIRHFSTMIGRGVNKDITILEPLLDAHLKRGDRVNATLKPITSFGNTITIRKFATEPWTITDFIAHKTIDYETAAIIWQAVQYEQSVFIVGGTASGKTSALNVFGLFFPPNQRIITIEDTRELQLPKELHWVAMETRLPNPDGKGEITMLDCMVNALRMRPDRIIVGEIRRQKEAEVLFEAMRTGHSGYATFHATTVKETVNRLTTPPISLPKVELSTLGLIIVQHRDRRTGRRHTLQVAEILDNGEPNLLFQFDVDSGSMKKVNNSIRLKEQLKLFGGLDEAKAEADIAEKIKVLQWLVKNKIRKVGEVGKVISEYYSDKQALLNQIG